MNEKVEPDINIDIDIELLKTNQLKRLPFPLF